MAVQSEILVKIIKPSGAVQLLSVEDFPILNPALFEAAEIHILDKNNLSSPKEITYKRNGDSLEIYGESCMDSLEPFLVLENFFVLDGLVLATDVVGSEVKATFNPDEDLDGSDDACRKSPNNSEDKALDSSSESVTQNSAETDPNIAGETASSSTSGAATSASAGAAATTGVASGVFLGLTPLALTGIGVGTAGAAVALASAGGGGGSGGSGTGDSSVPSALATEGVFELENENQVFDLGDGNQTYLFPDSIDVEGFGTILLSDIGEKAFDVSAYLGENATVLDGDLTDEVLSPVAIVELYSNHLFQLDQTLSGASEGELETALFQHLQQEDPLPDVSRQVVLFESTDREGLWVAYVSNEDGLKVNVVAVILLPEGQEGLVADQFLSLNQLPAQLSSFDLGTEEVDRGNSVEVPVADLLMNVTDPEGQPLSISNLAYSYQNDRGELVENQTTGIEWSPDNSSFTFTPETVDSGLYTFGYQVDDGQGGKIDAEAYLDLTILLNKPPEQAEPIDLGVLEIGLLSSLGVSADNLLANISDINNDALSISGLSYSFVDSGGDLIEGADDGVVWAPDGSGFTFTPTDFVQGRYTFTYQVDDGNGGVTQAVAYLDLYLDEATILGTPQEDALEGDVLDNLVLGLDGDDQLIGMEGDDVVYGGEGEDVLISQRIYRGNDILIGGRGDDRYLVNYEQEASAGEDQVIIQFSAGDGHDIIQGRLHDNLNEGDQGDPTALEVLQFLAGISYQDVYFIGEGDDLLIEHRPVGDVVEYRILLADFFSEINPDIFLALLGRENFVEQDQPSGADARAVDIELDVSKLNISDVYGIIQGIFRDYSSGDVRNYSSATEILQFTSDINPEDIYFVANGNDLVIEHRYTEIVNDVEEARIDTITVKDFIYERNQGNQRELLDRIEFLNENGVVTLQWELNDLVDQGDGTFVLEPSIELFQLLEQQSGPGIGLMHLEELSAEVDEEEGGVFMASYESNEDSSSVDAIAEFALPSSKPPVNGLESGEVEPVT